MPAKDARFSEFLQWALPRLRMRWQGFRRVRRQVRKRVIRRLEFLGLHGLAAYRSYLDAHPEEWIELDRLCRIPISRFYRDGDVFHYLGDRLLPELARLAATRSDNQLRCWSVGAAGGEEPYTLAILWKLRLAGSFPNLPVRVLATEADEEQLARAYAACYTSGSFREMPADLRQAAFEQRGGLLCLAPEFRSAVELRQQDIRRQMPDETFHLILCRNLVFTYFDDQLQHEIAVGLHRRLLPGGALVLGKHERLPATPAGFSELCFHLSVYSASSR